MTLCHLSKMGLTRGAWVALLACSAAAAGRGEVRPIERADAATAGPGPADAAPGVPDVPDAQNAPDAGNGSSEVDAGPSPDAGLSCVAEDLGSQLGSPIYSGNTSGQLDRSESCGGEPGYGDVFLLWTAPATGQYRFDTCGSVFDTILSARAADCSGMELKCNDDAMACGTDSLQSRFLLDLVAGERIMLIVDGFDAEGQFQLNIEPN